MARAFPALLALCLLLPAPALADPISGENYGLDPLHPDAGRDPHDRWATMRVAIDRKGRPTACRVVESNLRSTEDRWLFCHGMMGWWRTDPVLKDGVAVPATVTVTLVDPSRETRKADRKAKARERRQRRSSP